MYTVQFGIVLILKLVNPKGGSVKKLPTGQEIVCHLSQGHAKVTKNLDFIHKRPN